MGFKYKFQSILDIKAGLEDLKKIKFGEANEELRCQNEKLNVILNEEQAQYEKMREKSSEGMTTKDLISYNNYMQRLKKSKEIQILVVQKATEAVKIARAELVEATKERKKFETLKEKNLEEYKEELYRKEQKELDELVTYKYNGGVVDGRQ